MALLSTLITRVRYALLEPVPNFWSDAELLALLNGGIHDLWRRTKDLYQDYHYTVDSTNVSMAASAATLTGVPADVAIVSGIEPRSLSTYRNLRFEYAHYMDAKMQTARASAAVDPNSGGTVYFAITGAGSPIAAPTIYVAPSMSTTVPLTLTYIPTIADRATGDANPIPGESDQALIDWTLAHTIDKDKDAIVPNRVWMAQYEDEVKKILIALAPRQDADSQVAEAIFECYWT